MTNSIACGPEPGEFGPTTIDPAILASIDDRLTAIEAAHEVRPSPLNAETIRRAHRSPVPTIPGTSLCGNTPRYNTALSSTSALGGKRPRSSAGTWSPLRFSKNFSLFLQEMISKNK